MADRGMKSKVTLTTFAPKQHGHAPYQRAPPAPGILVGAATRPFNKTDTRTGEIYHGLRGNFRAYVGNAPDDKTPYTGIGPDPLAFMQAASTDAISSGVLYLPDAFQGPLEMASKEAGDGSVVNFAYKISVEKAENAAGYSWLLTDMIPAEKADPLAGIIGAAAPVAAIEGPKEKPAK